jgi:hypothetical protein
VTKFKFDSKLTLWIWTFYVSLKIFLYAFHSILTETQCLFKKSFSSVFFKVYFVCTHFCFVILFWSIEWFAKKLNLLSRNFCFSFSFDTCLDWSIRQLIWNKFTKWAYAERLGGTRYIKVKVEHYLFFMFSPPKISWTIWLTKYICLHL